MRVPLLVSLSLVALAAACRTQVPARCPALPAAGRLTSPARAVATPILIRGATIWTAAGAVLPSADLLLRGGRIAAIGALSAEAGVRVIDARGKHVTPGLIDPHSHLGVYPVPHLTGNADGNEVVRPVSASARAADALWPQDPGIARALAAGVTTALVVPGSANLIGGEGVTIRLIPGRSAEELRFPGAPATLKLACGENPKRTYGEKGGPHTRMGNVARVRALLVAASEYRRRWARHREKLAAWRARGCPAKGDGGGEPEAPKRDLELETMVRVLEGELQPHWHCYRADEMLLLLELARAHGFRVRAFHHATEAYKIRRELAREGTGAVVWVNWWGFKAEALDAIPENAAMLLATGALAALHTDSPVVAQRFVHEAAQAYFRGRDAGLPISEDQALRLVTAHPARLLGIEREVGTIEPGKRADLAIWDGHPFSVYTRVERVLVDGHEVYERGAGARPTDLELGLLSAPPPLEGTAPPVPPPTLEAGWLQAPLARLQPAPAQGPTLAITGASVVHTMSGPAVDGGVVLLRGGRVVEVGARVTIPAGATRIEARGGVVTPGLIAAETGLGLVEVSLEASATEGSPRGRGLGAVRASLRASDALNPAGLPVATARAAGFTTAIVGTRGGLLSGQGAAFDLRDPVAARDTLVAPVAQHAWLGLAATRALGSRAHALARLRALLDDARVLARSRAAVEGNRFRKLAAPPRELEALVPVIERRLPLVIHVHRAADILSVLRLAEEQQLRVVLSGAAEAWRVAGEIARARVPVLVEVDRNLPESFDSLAARFDNAARLDRAGVLVAFSAAGDAHDLRLLRQLGGIASAWGLPRDRALAALTVAPARVFGLHDRGLLSPGARANLVVWSGDPLELSTRPLAVVVDGELHSPVTRQTLLRDRYR